VVVLLERALAHLREHHHNPAEFLVEEAIRWTKMPIASWYLEASEDPNMSAFISKLMRRGRRNLTADKIPPLFSRAEITFEFRDLPLPQIQGHHRRAVTQVQPRAGQRGSGPGVAVQQSYA
jgi:hypothetical protein